MIGGSPGQGQSVPSKDRPPVLSSDLLCGFAFSSEQKHSVAPSLGKGGRGGSYSEVEKERDLREKVSEKDMAQIWTLVSGALHSLERPLSVPAEGDTLSPVPR